MTTPSTERNLLDVMSQANQMKLTGTQKPPNLANVKPAVSQAASPLGLPLQTTVVPNKTLSDKAAQECRSYNGLTGLRKLQERQGILSEYASGCGWIYNATGGLVPTVSRGAVGNRDGPFQEKLPAGATWKWDLSQAEKEIASQMCSSVQKCDLLKRLGQQADMCGYCRATNRMIPVKKSATGAIVPSYPSDPNLNCDVKQIVTSKQGQCPPSTQGFVNYDELFNCTPPLSKKCVEMAAQYAGCSAKGTLLTALSPSAPYDSVLKGKPGFQLYAKSANPAITPAILRDGSASIDVAIQDFQTLQKNTQSNNPRLRAAAKDLCERTGFVEPFVNVPSAEVYNFCNDMKDTDIIQDEVTMKCLEKYWYANDGTPAGTKFPRLAEYKGKTYAYFKNEVAKVLGLVNSSDKTSNSLGLRQLTGDMTDGIAKPVHKMPKDYQFTNGSETLWFAYDLPGINVPVLLRSSLNLGKDNHEIVPSWESPQQLQGKYNIQNPYDVATVSVFQVIADKPTNFRFAVKASDGVAISQNRMPFEDIARNRNPPTWSVGPMKVFETENYSVSDKEVKTFTVQNFVDQSRSHTFAVNAKLANGTVVSVNNPQFRSMVFLTQEPLAPWLQFEICRRLNKGASTVGFLDRRFAGQIAISQ